MWILRYQYDLENGDIKHVSCCLRLDETYNIGRSSKNLLNIKNDKSISRQHVSVCYENNEDLQLRIVNQGKMTAVSGKYLKKGESMSFGKSKETVLVELGTKPIKMQIQWIDSSWMVPQEDFSRYSFLKELGIELLSNDINGASLIVIDELRNHDLWLYGLVKRIPVMKSKFLHAVSEKVSDHETDFDSIWGDIMNDRNLRCQTRDVPSQILGNLDFLTVGEDKVTSSAIEAAGGKYLPLKNITDLQEAIKTRSTTDNVVILRSHLTPVEDLKSLGKTFTVQDVVEAILKDNVNSLKNGVIAEATKRPETEAPVEKPITKKRRLNRPRVKPLDILSFFAGGDSMKESQEESTMKLNSQQEESRSPMTVRENSKEESAPKKNLKTLQEYPEEESKKSYQEPERVLEPESKNYATESTDQHPTLLLTESAPAPAPAPAPEPAAEKSNKENTRPQRNPTLKDYRKSDSPSQNDMIQMIQHTKNREVKRINSTIVQVNDEELTEDAINQLGNLVLVDRNDNLMRRRNQSPTLDSHNPNWNNRKNFKKFTKVWPKYGGQESANREGSSDSVRNRAFLLTRQYVPTRTYTGEDSSRQVDEDLCDFPQPQPQQEERPSSPVPSVPQMETPGPNNNLFVMDDDDDDDDDDDSQDVVLQEPEKPVRPLSSHLIDDKDSDSDSDDDEPKFQFKRRKR